MVARYVKESSCSPVKHYRGIRSDLSHDHTDVDGEQTTAVGDLSSLICYQLCGFVAAYFIKEEVQNNAEALDDETLRFIAALACVVVLLGCPSMVACYVLLNS